MSAALSCSATFPASHHLLKCVRRQEALCHICTVLASERSCSRNAAQNPEQLKEKWRNRNFSSLQTGSRWLPRA